MPPRPRRRRPAPLHPHVPPVLDWTVAHEWTRNGRRVIPGTELRISGERGRFRFVKYVSRPNGTSWVDVIGGPKGFEKWRSFRPERVRTVHRLSKTRANAKAPA